MAKPLTKSQIAAEVAEKAAITKKNAAEILEIIAQLAYKHAKNSFTLPGLGKLVLVKRVAGRVVPPKKRVTLYLDAAVVERFKQQAGERGYQTLINETLKSSFEHADIEETLRKVIREELRTKVA